MHRLKNATRAMAALFLVTSGWLCSALTPERAAAQIPVPTNETPTLNGGTPIDGMAVGGQIGYAALRAAFYFGRGNWDLAVDAGIPTFGANDWLHGYDQSLGLDLRVPFRFRIVQWGEVGSGAFKVGPFFHVGRGGWDRGSVGTGALFGFVTDFALPKLFKVIAGIEQQFGFVHLYDRDDRRGERYDGYTAFVGQTYFDIGLEAFWRNIFFTLMVNVGAQYGSNNWHNSRPGDHALYRQLLGVGYKFN